MDRFGYLLLLAACLLLTVPVELASGARVWRRVPRLARTLWFPVALFVVWDTVFLARHNLSYNPAYLSGWRLPFSLPIEDLAFLVVAPVWGLVVYEAVQGAGRRRRGERAEEPEGAGSTGGRGR